ncbi:MAG: GMP synthase (glutamine-hydrolyzing), partial [Flavobacteriaceae bacterium]|nr:GMP synthase (glutamine-hydrolyzing) [Flavobacteriaceae bacterium]
MQNKVLILDFGSQYTQLIARRVRELNVYCEIFPYNNIPKNINKYNALILSGSPFSVRDNSSPKVDIKNLIENLPVLAICYGAQMIAQNMGGLVSASNIREYGRANLTYINNSNMLFKG